MKRVVFLFVVLAEMCAPVFAQRSTPDRVPTSACALFWSLDDRSTNSDYLKPHASVPPAVQRAIQACIADVKAYYPIAWRVLVQSYVINPNGMTIANVPRYDPELVSSREVDGLHVRTALAAEFGHACDQFRKPPPAKPARTRDEEYIANLTEMYGYDYSGSERMACTVEIELLQPDLYARLAAIRRPIRENTIIGGNPNTPRPRYVEDSFHSEEQLRSFLQGEPGSSTQKRVPGPDCAPFLRSDENRELPASMQAIRACIAEMKATHPIAWKALSREHVRWPNGSIVGDESNHDPQEDEIQSEFVSYALKAEFGQACEYFKKPPIASTDKAAQRRALYQAPDWRERSACAVEIEHFQYPGVFARLAKMRADDEGGTYSKQQLQEAFLNVPLSAPQIPQEDIFRQDEIALPPLPAVKLNEEEQDHSADWKSRLLNAWRPIADGLMTPGNFVVSKLFWIISWVFFWRNNNPVAGYEFVPAFLISWYVWLSAIRVSYCLIGRLFGFYNPEHFRLFSLLWLPWRAPYRRFWFPYAGWREERTQFGKTATGGTAGLFTTMAHLYRPGQIYLGRFRPFGLPGFQPIGADGRGGKHLFMVAGTGSGKTTHLITMLGLHQGTAFIIDPKGQMAKAMAGRMGEGSPGIRGKHRKVRILDPSRMVEGHESACWNPFDAIHDAEERARRGGLRNPQDAALEFAQKMMDGLIVKNPKSDPFWPGAARDFLLGVILHVYTTEPREHQHLTRLYELITVGLPEKVKNKETGFDALLWEMRENRAFGGVIRASATGIAEAGENTSGSVLITMREQLQWLKRPSMRTCTERSNFSLEELKTGNLVLFVCAKPGDIREEFPAWFRLLTVMALATFEDIKGNLKDPCLFALDEFASLGKLDRVEEAAPYMRSFGVRLLCIVQNIGQLSNGLYDNWETFIGNAECCWWMATNHADNLKYLEERLGMQTVTTNLGGRSWWGTSSRMRPDYKEREVMTAEQIGRFLARGNMIVTRSFRAFVLKPEPYFKALPVYFYEPDRDYREARLRSFTRAVFELLIGPSRHAMSKPSPAPSRPAVGQSTARFGEEHKNGKPLHARMDRVFRPATGTYGDRALRTRVYSIWLSIENTSEHEKDLLKAFGLAIAEAEFTPDQRAEIMAEVYAGN